MKKTLFALTLLIVSHMTLAYPEGLTDWKHINLKAKDGTKIAIDYKLACFTWSYGYACHAHDIWVNVTSDQNSRDSKVRVVFKNFSRKASFDIYGNRTWSDLYDGEKIETDIVDLDFQEDGHFSNTIDSNTNIFQAFQEISVVMDGKWLVDPVNGTGNFRFNLLEM